MVVLLVLVLVVMMMVMSREVSVGWQRLGVDTRAAWVVGGGRVLSHRQGEDLVVRDFRRGRGVQGEEEVGEVQREEEVS